MLVGIHGPDTFLNPYAWVNAEEGNVCPVLHCRFDLQEAEPLDIYAKAVDLHSMAGRVMCLNEITGWLLAQTYGLPTAERAFMASIRAAELPPFSGATPLPAADAGGSLYFFCTQAISRSQARGIIANEALLNEQACWPHAHDTITLDETTGNSDRHLNNLVRKSAGNFALIDHGRLMHRDAADDAPSWQTHELEDLIDARLKNLLHFHAYNCRGISAPAAVAEGLEQCRSSARHQAKNMRRVFYEISCWCATLLPGASARWLELLNQRLHRIDTLLHYRFGLLPLD